MKWTIGKWLTQVALSCLLSILAFMCLRFLVRVRVMWVFWVFLPIPSTLGIVFGDLPLYKGKKLSVIVVSMTYCLGFIGLVIGTSLGQVFWDELFPDSLEEAFLVLSLTSLLGLIAPSLVGYNSLTFVQRKFKSRKSDKEER